MFFSNERGFAMAALLVAMTVMAIMMGALLPAWHTQVQREKEAELVFRGQQYVQAIELYSRRYGGFPTSLESLTSQNNHFLRKIYKDPITGGDFQLVYFGQVALAPPQGAQGAQGRQGAPGAAAGLQQLQGARGATALPTAQPIGQPGQAMTNPQANVPGLVAATPTGQQPQNGAGPIIGVVSKSKDESIRIFNGREHYNEWLFIATAATQQAGAPAGGQAGGRGAPGQQQPGRGVQGPQGRGNPPGRGVPPPGRGDFPGREDFPGRGGPGRGFPGQGLPGAGGFPPFGNPNQPGRF
jgi:type II secretory pathway pseudopilin PulG